MKAHNENIADLTESYSVIKLIYGTGVSNPPQNDFKEYIRHFKISLSSNSCIACNYSYFAMCKLSFIIVNADENCVTLVSAMETENSKIKQYKNLRYRQNGLKQTKMKILIVHNHVSKQKEKKPNLLYSLFI